MKKTKVGFAIEETFGEKLVNSEPIMLSPIQETQIKSKTESVLTVNARFDCPCCGKGISIKIDKKI